MDYPGWEEGAYGHYGYNAYSVADNLDVLV